MGGDMHSEQAVLSDECCCICGLDIWWKFEPSFVLGPEANLCLVCAVTLGGRYDVNDGRWLIEPRMDENVRVQCS